MKKWLSLLFTGLLLCGVFSCGETTTNTNEEDKGNSIYYEWEHYDPRTHHTFVKGKDYGIVRELTAEEKNELILSVKDECPKSVSGYDHGSLYYGHKITLDTGEEVKIDRYSGACVNIYKNATEGYYKETNYPTISLPSINCYFKDGHDYTYVRANYLKDSVSIAEYKKEYVEDDEYYTPTSYITPFNDGLAERHFYQLAFILSGDNIEMVYEAYKTSTGYLLKYVPRNYQIDMYERLYNYYEVIYLFNKSKQLTEGFGYFEPTEEGKQNPDLNYDRHLSYQMYRYSDTGETPTKDLSFIKDELKTADYLYLERPSFTFGRVDSYEDLYNMTDNDFIIGVECSFFSSSYYSNSETLNIYYQVEIPFVDMDDTKYNAILASFSFEIKGKLNGKYFSKWFVFKFTEEDRAFYGTTDLNKDGTAVVYIPDENLQPNKKFVYTVGTTLEIKDNDLVLNNDMYLGGRIDIIEI